MHIDRWGVANHIVFRFKDPETAEEMCHLFGGETYDANDKSKGSGWEKWRKKPPMKKAS